MKRIPAEAILIVDNGRNYSAHELYFVSTTGFPVDLVNLFVARIFEFEAAESNGEYIVGVVQTVDWWDGGARPFDEFLEGAFGYWTNSFTRAAKFFAGVADNIVRQLVATWLKRFVDDAEERLERVEPRVRRNIQASVEAKRARTVWFEEFLARRARGDFDEDGNWRPGAPGALQEL